MSDDKKKGFSGLIELVSKIETSTLDRKAEDKRSASKQSTQPPREAVNIERDQKRTSPHRPKHVKTDNASGGTGGKWILGIIGVIFVIWLINSEDQSNKKPSNSLPSSSQNYSYPQSSTAPAVQPPSTTQSAGLQYTKPSVGTNNVLSIPEIRWCVREDIRIEAMRNIPVTDKGIDAFNLLVSDYNLRCSSFRYKQGTLQRAEKDVGAYRNQIVAEARNSARTMDGTNPSARSFSNDSAGALLIREAQSLLNDLGYSPGSADGIYGPRTASAVKNFQRDFGMSQDGKINQQLVDRLKRSLQR